MVGPLPDDLIGAALEVFSAGSPSTDEIHAVVHRGRLCMVFWPSAAKKPR
jgi:hypothetical protein